MKRRFLCAIGATLTLVTATAALAQTPEANVPPAPAERSIRFDRPDRVVAEIVRPMGDAIDGFAGLTDIDLIPDRLTMVDLLIDSANEF